MAKASSASTNPIVAAIVKHHFWMLLPLVPLVLLPLLFLARGSLTKQIEGMRSQIQGHLTAMENVRKITQHPNASWSNQIEKSTKRVRRETYAEWRKFWQSQESIRVWPEALGPDFLRAVTALKPDGKLSRTLLERYQNMARSLVWELPNRMDVESHMSDPADTASGASVPSVRPPALGSADPIGAGRLGAGAPQTAHICTWNPDNQRMIASSFIWETPPPTLQVLLAQEELWVYGLLCDVVKRLNKSATGPHNAAIAAVEDLLVGYPAAEDNPGGISGGRIARIAAAVPGAPMEGSAGMAPGGEGGAQIGRPDHPRFSGNKAAGPAMPAPGQETEPAAAQDPEQKLRNWIYVDFDGKPLTAEQLSTAVDSQMVHLMPFVLRVTIDERQIDALLVDLASSPVPIDVRQVRVNPSASTTPGGSGAMPPSVSAPGSATSSAPGRMHDVHLELRGTVGLATPPDEKTVGLEPDDLKDEEPGGGDQKPDAAAVLGRPSRRWRTAS